LTWVKAGAAENHDIALISLVAIGLAIESVAAVFQNA